jgi:uncharacterized protein YecT (DUF1311 family)
MRDCVGTAYQQMDNRLNDIYSLLMAKLPPQKREILKDAQRKWLAYREAELKLSKSINPNAGGTIALITDDSDAYDILKKRTIELERHFKQTK